MRIKYEDWNKDGLEVELHYKKGIYYSKVFLRGELINDSNIVEKSGEYITDKNVRVINSDWIEILEIFKKENRKEKLRKLLMIE